MKKTTNRWCVYQKRSKLALRGFSMAVNTMAISAINIMYPDHPGPVNRFPPMKPLNPRRLTAANLARLFQCAMVWTQEKNTMDQPTSL
jgi:hypothetical protein